MVARRRSDGEKMPDSVPLKDDAFPQTEETEEVRDSFFLYFATVIGNKLA